MRAFPFLLRASLAALPFFLSLVGSTWAGQAGPQDPASRPVLRHILPEKSLDLVLRRGNLQILSWKDLTRIMREGLTARKLAKKNQTSKRDLAQAQRTPYRFDQFEVKAIQRQDGEDVHLEILAEIVTEAPEARIVPLIGSGPIPSGFSARKSGAPSPGTQLVPVDGGWGVLLEGLGRWKLKLEAWTSVTQKGHLRQVQVAIPPVPGAVGQITLPGGDLDVFMDPAPETERLKATSKTTRTRARIPPGTPFQAHWFPRDTGLPEQAGKQEVPALPKSGLRKLGARVFSTWSQTLVLGQGRMDALVRLDLEIHRTPISLIQVRFQGNLENLECAQDPRLIEEVRAVPGGLDIFLRGSRMGKLPLNLSYRYRDPQGRPSFQLTVPRLRVENAYSERSFLWVGRSTNVEIAATLKGRIEAATDGTLPSFRHHPAASDPLMRFRLEDNQASLSLKVERFPDAPVTTRVADQMVATTQLARRGRAKTSVELQVRDRRRVPLLFQLPKGARVTGFWRDGTQIPSPPLSDEGYRIPLQAEGETKEEANLRVTYQQDLPEGALGNFGKGQLSLAHFDTPIMELTWTLTPPEGYSLHSPHPTGMRHGNGIRIQRRLLVSGSAPSQVRTSFRYLSPVARDLSRMVALGIGLLTGWLLCALLVGSAPFSAGIGLLAPGLISWFFSEPEALFLCLEGILAAFCLGLLLGLRHWWESRRVRKLHRLLLRTELVERMITLRRKLTDEIAKVAPKKEPTLKEAVTNNEREGEPPASEPEDPPPPPKPAPSKSSSSKRNRKGRK
jgi:hypothetical protein